MAGVSKTVVVRYYAMLREARGSDSETIITSAETVRALYAELQAAHKLRVPHNNLKVAVNDEMCDWDQSIIEGDRVAFIPPVAGGA